MALGACAGRYEELPDPDASDQPHLSTGGSRAEAPAIAVPGAIPSGSAGVRAGSGASSPEVCTTPPLLKAVGARTCPADSPALRAYSDNNFPECTRLKGPISQRRVAQTWICGYDIDESGCELPSSGHIEIELPYFGSDEPSLVPDHAIDFALCDQPRGADATSSNEVGLARQLTGLWLSCSGPRDPFWEDALLLQSDGTFQALSSDASGRLRPRTGCGSSGLWGLARGTRELHAYFVGAQAIATVTITDGTGESGSVAGMVLKDGGKDRSFVRIR